MASVLALALVAALLAIGSVAVQSVLNDRAALRALVHERLDRVAGQGKLSAPTIEQPKHPAWQWVEARLWRAGIEFTRWHMIGVIFVSVFAVGMAALLRGPIACFAMALAIAVGALWFVTWRTERRRQMILEQLPGFLDHVQRAVQTGSSLPNAMVFATGEMKEPIRGLFERVVRQTRYGATLEDAFEQAAGLYSLRELNILAMTMKVSQRYGGSVREILASIVTMIRQRERMRREFAAMTGETRLSALVLGGLPIGMALYVSIVNPEYIGGMWEDPDGRNLLLGSVALQVFGSVVLWRMIKSV